MKTRYTPPPLRESREHKTIEDLQQELNLMRAMYAQRRSLNRPRHDAMVGWSLVAVGVLLPIIIVIGILI
jgi:hypothetical protein